MEQAVSKSRFKPRALEYFRKVEESGEELIITDNGRPVLKIVPYRAAQRDARGALRGTIRRYDRPLDPVGMEDWDALK